MKEKKKKRLRTLLVLCLVLFLLAGTIIAVHMMLSRKDHWAGKSNNSLVKDDVHDGPVYLEDDAIRDELSDTDDLSDADQKSIRESKKYGTATGHHDRNSKPDGEVPRDEVTDMMGESEKAEDQRKDEESKSPSDQKPEDKSKNPGGLNKPGGALPMFRRHSLASGFHKLLIPIQRLISSQKVTM